MRWFLLALLPLVLRNAPACGAETQDDPAAFARTVIESLLSEKPAVTFPVAERVFTLDNGETLTRQQVLEVWPQLGRTALKKRVDANTFFRDVVLQIWSPLDNKRLMANKRVLAAYQPQQGDLYCDASRMKAGTEDIIGYAKALVFVIRKLDGRWTLIGIGG